MNTHQVVPPRSSSNGYGRRKTERDFAVRLDNKLQTGKTSSSSLTSTAKGGGVESPSRDRLIYMTTCLVGHQVEVQLLDGSVFSGVFHAANTDKDFGIILKMARLIKDGSRGPKGAAEFVSKPPSKSLIIHAKDLVQVIAKGVPVTRDGLMNDFQYEKQPELLTDSHISQFRRIELERELERWIPDEDDPGCSDLENIFDKPGNRGWDQFEANETLFGVKSTFNEDLYTTKLDKGPQMRELEKEAIRIAREIEGEATHDLHLAEERGIRLSENVDIDEEMRYSSVLRPVDDSGYDEIEDILVDSHNSETFGGGCDSVVMPMTASSNGKTGEGAQSSFRSSSLDEILSSQTSTSRECYRTGSDDHGRQLSAEHFPKSSLATDASGANENYSTGHSEDSHVKGELEKQKPSEETQTSKVEDSHSVRPNKDTSDKAGLSPDAAAYAPSHVPSKVQEKTSSSNEPGEGGVSSKTQGLATSLVRPSSSASSASDRGGATSTSAGRGLSPSSSVGSLSSEKSTLNPNAKEFRLNPNAKSFVPSQIPLRPASPVADSSLYYPANMATHMHGMPFGVGIGPPFAAQQPVIYNPQGAPLPQPYFHPSGPQYGQQMMIGQPRQVMYMQTYPPEMPYKGRDF